MAAALQPFLHLLVAIEHPHILAHLVVAKESVDNHAADAFTVLHLNLEVTYQIVGEVIACQLIEQLIAVDGVWTVSQHEVKAGVTFRAQRIDGCRVTVVHDSIATVPHVSHIKMSAMQPTSLLHTSYNHTGDGAYLIIGILLNHRLHTSQTAVGLSVVKQGQSFDEDELRPVGTLRETLCRQTSIGFHLLNAVSAESIIGGSVK